MKVGLGRGKGTKVVSRYSILHDDDVSPKIVNRVLTLCRLFLRENIVTVSDLKNSLGIVDALPSGTISMKEYNKLKEDVESLKVTAETEKRRGDMEFNRANRLLETVDSQRGKINAYNRLREDNEALKVKAEMEGRRADEESRNANNLQATVNVLQGKIWKLEKEVSDVESSRSRLVKELDEDEAEGENSNEILDSVIEEIEKRTEYEFDETGMSKEEFIADVVPRLLEDIEVLKVENEK